MIKSGYRIALLSFLLLILSIGFAANLNVLSSPGRPHQETPMSRPVAWNGDFTDGWRNYDQLVKEQKFEAASSLAEKMLAAARDRKIGGEWTRALIRCTQTRVALHGYETAVRFLRDQPWPDDLESSSLLHLFYAETLVTYAREYSWEINRRERMDSSGEVDLKAWTRDQIYEEAQKAFARVWHARVRLGDLPVARWKEYLSPNTYPAGIRPTLRDAVSYLRVDMLSDTNGWRPEQLSEIYRLNLKSLIRQAEGEISLVDPARHPLEKISVILADLENWHLQKNEREAALEARLELYRRLHEHFTEAEDRERIERDLEEHLKALAGVPWWAEGMAQLAEFIRTRREADALVRAHEVAAKGRTAFPDSTGGRHCLAIEKDIESPDYVLSGMQNDNPLRKSILVTHKNLPRIYFRAYSCDLLRAVETSDDYNLLPAGRELEKLVSGATPSHQWEAPLPPTPDYRMHKTYVIPPMDKPGVYLVVASARPGFPKTDNRLIGLHMALGDLVPVMRHEGSEAEVTVLSGSSGKPVAGAEVMLYRLDWQKGHRRADLKLTDERGIALFRVEGTNARYFLIARRGNQITFDPQVIVFQPRPVPGESSATLLFTDRSIYRPMQKLYWKAVLYKSGPDEKNFRTLPSGVLTVSLRDANNQVVESKTVTTNGFGTASGEFFIPPGRVLGQWHLQSSANGQMPVRVEEYKRPTFEVRMLDPEEPLRLNRTARMKGEAKYYFGLPVTSGRVRWVVRREPVFPSWWNFLWWGDSGMPFRSQVVAGGAASLKEDGTFSFSFLPEIDERLGKDRDVTYRYSVSADVTDEGGETRTARRAFRLGLVSVEASAALGKAFFLEDEPVQISIMRASLDGVPKAGKGAWRIAALKGPPQALLPAEQPLFESAEYAEKGRYRTPGDLERERWRHLYNPEAVLLQWEEGPARASGSVSHDESGTARIVAGPLAPGAYRLIYETTDDFGAKCEMRKNFIVAAPSMRLQLPAIFALENPSVPVGGAARVLVHSGLKDQHVVLEVYRAGKCIRRSEMLSGTDPSLVEIPITEQDRGGLGLTMTLVRDNQLIALQSSLMVPWDNKQLKVEFSTFRDHLRPGRQETWSVKVSGPAGKDVAVPAAELLAYMYDRSLDAFVPHSPANPLSLFPYRSWSTTARANLREANRLYLESRGFTPGPGAPVLNRDHLIFYSGYGIGGVGRRYKGGREGVMAAGRVMSVAEAGDMKESRVSQAFLKLESADAEAKVVELRTEAGAAPEIEMRSDFSETAFWRPHLLAGPDGSVAFEFKVPDSVTSWNVWVHAITRDLKSGSVRREARSVKELMVRPYLPRFLREGDEAEIKVVVNNASDKALTGTVRFDIVDTETDQSLLSQFGLSASGAGDKPFTVPAGGGSNVSFSIKTPPKVGQIAFKVTAVSGDFSDGELRPIPVLPGRMHLMQSRFVTMKDRARRVIRFDDLARADDPTRINGQMVVTLDAQLFYSVLEALPYLVNYPYECTEQTLNRFVSTGILASLYAQYPAVARMAKEFSSRETRFERWDASDPNRRMALEETPWLGMAKGGEEASSDLINVLDSRVAKAQRESSLAKLRKSQTSSGGFPWFPGGPPSPYMTLYILYGFSKALEFGVEAPRDIVSRAWDYMHRHYLDEVVRDMIARDCCWEFVTFINYVLSNYPDGSWYEGSFTDAERKTMLDFSFKHWKSHTPYLKGFLALTLKRMGRPKDAMLVWESVMDSAKTVEDQGTFWAPEDRAWLWYNDTIETHAFAVRTGMELVPDDPRLDGLVLWLFLNKKLNHWKSTRATAEAIYSLAHYLKKTEQLGVREDASVTVGNQKADFVFEPDRYTGKKNRIVIPGEKIDPQKTSSIVVEKTGKGYLFASATWHFSTERLPAEASGDYLRLTRSYFKRVNTGREFILQPLEEGAALAPGDEVEVHLSLTSKHPMEYVHLRDPRAAGFEPAGNLSRHKWDLGLCWYEEIRDSGTSFFFERIPQGEYTFKYRIRAATGGAFKVAPATVQPMYAPEFSAYSSGAVLRISRAD